MWGARKTGKSFFLKNNFKDSVYYDLLKTDEVWRFLKQPSLLREEVLALSPELLAKPIIVDEIQKVPDLLNEIHWLIENTAAYFILCGSSARQLKRVGVNLLGGRAWRYEFYPLTYPEIPNFNLLQALQKGLIPSHYTATHWDKTVKAYIRDYLEEEIKAEGLTRNIAAFARFLDVMAFSHGELINYSNIARDCGIDSKTIKEYYQILVDTLLGYYLLPYKSKKKRNDVVETPKFYFFDVGIVNGLTHRRFPDLKGKEAGAAFEHYIFMELMAYRGLRDLNFNIAFWRSRSGQEVDFILGDGEVAIEVKISATLHPEDTHGLIAFQQHYQPKHCYLLCTTPRRRKMTASDSNQFIEILPWEIFIKMLWNGEIIR